MKKIIFNYPLIGLKSNDFKYFERTSLMIKSKAHLTE